MVSFNGSVGARAQALYAHSEIETHFAAEVAAHGAKAVAQQPAGAALADADSAKRVQQVARMSDVLSPPGGPAIREGANDKADLETDAEIELDFYDYSPEADAYRKARDEAYEKARMFLTAEYKKRGQKVSPDVEFAAALIATAQVNKAPLINETALKVIKELNLEGTEWDVKGLKEISLFFD